MGGRGRGKKGDSGGRGGERAGEDKILVYLIFNILNC
jgi:hypothetical protein